MGRTPATGAAASQQARAALPRRILATARMATRWHLHSQEVARRNAMVASTALAQRRRELLDAEEFLARHQRRHDARLAREAGVVAPGAASGADARPGPLAPHRTA